MPNATTVGVRRFRRKRRQKGSGMLRFNAKGDIVIPFFRAGEPDADLAAMLETLAKIGR